MKSFYYIILSVGVLFVSSCNKEEQLDVYKNGLKPIYSENENFEEVSSVSPGQITKGSKIYIKDDFVYIVESGLGVHVIDNSNPNTPSDIRFLKIGGISDIAIKNNMMYANQRKDILAINIQDIMEINVSKRIEDVYDLDIDQFPLAYNGYFDCVDNTKGIVVAWEEALLKNPKCIK